MITLSGWHQREIRETKLFRSASIILFTLASILACMSDNVWELVFFRVMRHWRRRTVIDRASDIDRNIPEGRSWFGQRDLRCWRDHRTNDRPGTGWLHHRQSLRGHGSFTSTFRSVSRQRITHDPIYKGTAGQDEDGRDGLVGDHLSCCGHRRYASCIGEGQTKRGLV